VSRTIVYFLNHCFYHLRENTTMKQMPAQTLVHNLNMLLNKTNISISELSRRSGVTGRMIHYILNGERTPSVDIAGKLAGAFGLTGWQLIMPSLPYDLAKTGELDKLIENYSHCDTTTQSYVNQVMMREATYNLEIIPPTDK
jgi:transcriptional regulator with XRE-family HTH domain